MQTKKEYTLKSVKSFINSKTLSIMKEEEILTPDQKDTWSRILKFAIEVLKLIVSGFLGGSASNLLG